MALIWVIIPLLLAMHFSRIIEIDALFSFGFQSIAYSIIIRTIRLPCLYYFSSENNLLIFPYSDCLFPPLSLPLSPSRCSQRISSSTLCRCSLAFFFLSSLFTPLSLSLLFSSLTCSSLVAHSLCLLNMQIWWASAIKCEPATFSFSNFTW